MMWDAGLDLHATTSGVGLLDEEDRVVYQKRLCNDWALILAAREPPRSSWHGIAVASTDNWYWLVDGLMDAG